MHWIALILILATSTAEAQEVEEEATPLARGIEQLLRDLFSEVEPALRDLRDQIDNLNNYEAPEMLPNGDIIIRRKTPLEPSPEPKAPEVEEAEPGDPIEL